MNSKRGIFIVFEGLDRCGKSTQVTKLIDYFKQKVCLSRFFVCLTVEFNDEINFIKE